MSRKPNIGKSVLVRRSRAIFKHYFIDNIFFLWLLLKEFVPR